MRKGRIPASKHSIRGCILCINSDLGQDSVNEELSDSSSKFSAEGTSFVLSIRGPPHLRGFGQVPGIGKTVGRVDAPP